MKKSLFIHSLVLTSCLLLICSFNSAQADTVAQHRAYSYSPSPSKGQLPPALAALMPPKLGDIVCPDQSHCSDDQQCCQTTGTQDYYCIPQGTTCCGNGGYCPTGTTCDNPTSSCKPN